MLRFSKFSLTIYLLAAMACLMATGLFAAGDVIAANKKNLVYSKQFGGNKSAQTTMASQTRTTDHKTALRIDSFDWQGEIPESRLVVVKNHFGSIRSRNHSEEKIYLHATYQEIGENSLKPEFEIFTQNHVSYITVKYAENILDAQGSLRGRTDISILFPDTVSIYAETDSGLIKIDKTASHVEAVTRSGKINLTTTGLFSVRSEDGEISLRLRGFKEFGQSRADSNSGTISALIFNDMAINLSAYTQGEIQIDNQKVNNGPVYSRGQNPLEVVFNSQSGDIKIETINPPALVQSVTPSQAHSVDVDLRNLPKAKPWKPGDPVFDRDDKKTNKQHHNKKNTTE